MFGDPNVTVFENVERIVYRASQDADFLAVDLGTLKINGDRLALDLTILADAPASASHTPAVGR